MIQECRPSRSLSEPLIGVSESFFVPVVVAVQRHRQQGLFVIRPVRWRVAEWRLEFLIPRQRTARPVQMSKSKTIPAALVWQLDQTAAGRLAPKHDALRQSHASRPPSTR